MEKNDVLASAAAGCGNRVGSDGSRDGRVGIVM